MSEHLTDADLAAIEKRADAAAPGPWSVMPSLVTNDSPSHYCLVVQGRDYFLPAHCYGGKRVENAAFIAAARSDVPALCREVLRLRADLEFQAGCTKALLPYQDEAVALRSQRDELLAACRRAIQLPRNDCDATLLAAIAKVDAGGEGR